MVAKNLLAFVGVGILSGLVFGLYLLEEKDGYFGFKDTAMRVDGPSISVIPTERIFDEGEQITFRIINSGSIPLYSEKGSYDATVTGLSGILIYTFGVQDVILQKNQTQQTVLHANMQQLSDIESKAEETRITNGPLKPDTIPYDSSSSTTQQILLPGDEIHMSWNQTRQNGESIQAGVYKINIQAHTTAAIGIIDKYNVNNTTQESISNTDIKEMVKDSITVTVQ